ncbi:DUF1800 domain-containing protein [Variovorax dokdonensis]|uniref:DUF1800 domain-containing protein n=1 Tax=Variovorax dokdonensis TaxID=344883 RepID=A0ABT7N9U2_9BURK|nr:DUF1800 domain-containing protein [Variovorax dokdonensis]MDM0044715.1 DUF1800 domain-containing protein [Variovorax dokdonensis]
MANSPTGRGYAYAAAKSDVEAARFLIHAQGWADDAQIAAVRNQGYLPWLASQFDAAPTQGGWAWLASKGLKTPEIGVDNMVWQQLMASPDSLRKRLALALSEIFVVSANDINASWPEFAMAQYWDTLVDGASGNFRDLLEAITLNPAMGMYLNTRGNQKEDDDGRQPDENYAREVMQLMTIGLVQLEPNGQPRRSADGRPLPTYSQDDVSQLARVFTGYELDIDPSEMNAFAAPASGRRGVSNGWTTRPMRLMPTRHSTLAANFLGASVPAGTDGKTALRIALDTLFNHPNVGPFIGRQLIQRLVTSNPSPGYVGRVATVFADNGAGVRGDMRSVFAAVLLDNEARAPAGLSDPNFGRLREPMLRLVQWARTFKVGSATDTWKVGDTSAITNLGQSPLRSPSVFNFFRPGFVPPSTAIAVNRMVAPEFQLVSEASVCTYVNRMQAVISDGLAAGDLMPDYGAERRLALDASALVDRLNLLLCAGQLSTATVNVIKTALGTPEAASGESNRDNRIFAGILLVMGCPEYLVQK